MPAIPSEFVPLVSAVVGGGIAAFALLGGHILTALLTRGRELDAERRRQQRKSLEAAFRATYHLRKDYIGQMTEVILRTSGTYDKPYIDALLEHERKRRERDGFLIDHVHDIAIAAKFYVPELQPSVKTLDDACERFREVYGRVVSKKSRSGDRELAVKLEQEIEKACDKLLEHIANAASATFPTDSAIKRLLG